MFLCLAFKDELKLSIPTMPVILPGLPVLEFFSPHRYCRVTQQMASVVDETQHDKYRESSVGFKEMDLNENLESCLMETELLMSHQKLSPHCFFVTLRTELCAFL